MSSLADKYTQEIEKYFSTSLGSYQPNIFPLGYYVRRHEPRLLYVMPLTMTYEGQPLEVKSKNFSPNGLQVYMPRTFILEGEKVLLSFNKFIKDQEDQIGNNGVLYDFDNIDYLIKEVKHTGEKTYISLIQQNLPEATKAYFHRFIAKNRLRYKIDASDVMVASKAQYYENLYTCNMQHIPFFIRWSKARGFYIDAIIKTEKNSAFFSYFSKKGVPANDEEIDFSALSIPHRIERFTELARQNETALLFTYWENERLYTVCDFELESGKQCLQIAAKVKNRRGRVFRIATNLNKKPSTAKITAMLGKIQTVDAMSSKVISNRTLESIAQVVLTDISNIFFRKIYSAKTLAPYTEAQLSFNLISGNQQYSGSDKQLIHTFSNSHYQSPEIIYFGIGHQRYDERYEYEMDISLEFKNKRYPARTIDFSRTGMGLATNQAIDIMQGDELKITFTSLLVKGITTQLKHIPHRAMIVRKTNNGLFLGVIRNTYLCSAKVNHFFSNLVKKNKDKLELCIKDKVDTVNATFYKAFVTENLQAIPIIIARDRNNHHYIREIGLTDTPCNLAEKFYIKDKGYLFRFLTTELRLNEFHQRAIQASAENPQSFMLYLFKGKNEQGVERVFSVTDFEVIHNEEIDKIIKIVLERNGVCILVKFLNNLQIDKSYRNMTLDKVYNINKASAKLLTQEYKEIIGFAELLDLTQEFKNKYA